MPNGQRRGTGAGAENELEWLRKIRKTLTELYWSSSDFERALAIGREKGVRWNAVK